MKTCPNCRKPVNWEGNEFRPFCSERCKILDLGAWASEEYAVPSNEAPPFEEAERGPHTSSDGADGPRR